MRSCVFLAILQCLCIALIFAFDGSNQGFASVADINIDNTEVEIDLSHNAITTVGEWAFSSFTELQTLDLSSNGLQEISVMAFTGTQLQTLHIHDNILAIFPDLTDVALTITNIYASKNRFVTIDNAVLQPLVNVQQLDLSENPLEIWPDFTGLGSNAFFTLLRLDSVKTLPLEVSPSVCYVSQFRMSHAMPGVLKFACPDDGSSTLYIAYLQANSITHTSNFTGLVPLANSGSFTSLILGSNPIEEFPALPMAVRSSLTFLSFFYTNLQRIQRHVLEGYSLNTLNLGNTKIERFSCRLFHITVTLWLNDIDTLSMDRWLWTRCFCKREAHRVQIITLDESMDTLAQFPDLSDVLCKTATPLTMRTNKVTIE